MNRTSIGANVVFTVCLGFALLAPVPGSSAAIPTIEVIPSVVETVPVQTSGDSADDPAVWVHPTSPDQSLIIVNNKRGALETYNLSGQRVQQVRDSVRFWGNVDIRPSVVVGNTTRDVVAVAHRGLQFYTVNPQTRLLQSITDGVALNTGGGEGVCLYRSPTSAITYAVIITIQGRLRQYELTDVDSDGLLGGRLVREIQVGSEAEGCVVDDQAQALYVSQEDVALWKYDAEPTGGSVRTVVDTVVTTGGQLEPDIEGLTIADTGATGKFLFASNQRVRMASANYVTAYQIMPDGTWTQHKAFRVGNGTTSDDCDRTDGIAAYAGNLGPSFPYGIFVCQDNNNDLPGTRGFQDVKFVRLEAILPQLVPVVEPSPPAPAPLG